MIHSTRIFAGLSLFLSGAACVALAACASHPPPPSQESTAPSASAAASASTDNAADASAAAINSVQDASITPTAPEDAPAKRGAITVDDGDDACQLAAAGFEKRARPQIKACYRDAKKKDPNLMGAVKIVVNVKPDGKIGNIVTSEKPTLPKPVVKCMLDAVKATDPGDANKCSGKTMIIPVQFPTQ